VYYKNMENKDRFQVTLTSDEYNQLQEMFSFCSGFDFTDHELSDNDPEIFDRLWDKVLNADHLH